MLIAMPLLDTTPVKAEALGFDPALVEQATQKATARDI
jgi:hypothetical protein